MKNRKAIIVGLSSTKLKDYEKKFLLKNKPWGVILFTRNIINIDQAKKLVFQIKKCFKDPNYPILIDEEGGRVNRLKKIIDTSIFTSEYFFKKSGYIELYKISSPTPCSLIIKIFSLILSFSPLHSLLIVLLIKSFFNLNSSNPNLDSK